MLTCTPGCRSTVDSGGLPAEAPWTDSAVAAFLGAALDAHHIAGPKDGRGRRMRRCFPEADVVVLGHSHIPLDEVQDGVHLLNPGSVADPRREPSPSFAVLTVEKGRWETRGVRFPRATRSPTVAKREGTS